MRCFALLPFVIATSGAVLTTPAQACGKETDCALGDHTYRIQLPEGHDKTAPLGALIFAHGYKGSARSTMRNASLLALADKLGLALVAVDAIKDDWSIPNAPSQSTSESVDEIAYFDTLRADLVQRHAIDPMQSVVTGFSAGGMLVWNLACSRPQDYAGFVPISGTFWDPVPQGCETPVANIIHIHGTTDKIVPLAGRPIAETKQGSLDDAFAMYLALGQHKTTNAPQIDDNLTCQAWQSASDTRLMKCLHPGGHGFKASYIEGAWAELMRPR